MKIGNTLYVIIISCLLASCGTKETVIRFRAEAYNGYQPSVIVGQTSWKADMDSVQGTGTIALAIDHPVQATVKYGKHDNRVVYLEPGKTLDIAYGCERSNKYFTVTGDLQAENEFLVNYDFYACLPIKSTLSSAEMKKQADSVMQTNLQRLEETAFSEPFKELQKKQLLLQTGNWINRSFRITDTLGYIKAMQAYMPETAEWMEIPGYCDYMKGAVRRLGMLQYSGKNREEACVQYVLENITEPTIRAYLLDLNIMPILTVHGIAGNEQYVDIYRENIADTAYLAKLDKVVQTYARVAAGQPCPGFCLKDIDGKEVRLADLTGKYVYIDLWATWCGPCKGEMPALAELEEKFAGQDITFVSISIDRNKDIELWKKTVADMKLGGIQLHLGEQWDWVKHFMPTSLSVPRFILLDREGKIVDANMTRPSDKVTKQRFEKLLKEN